VQAKKRSGTPSAASSSSKQPEQFILFLDESLDSGSVATALRAAGAQVERLTDHFAKGTADEVWLEQAGKEGWIVLTRDKRIRYRKLERIALKMAGVRAFVFTGGNVTVLETGQILVRALPRIRAICGKVAGPFVYHIGRSGKPLRMD